MPYFISWLQQGGSTAYTYIFGSSSVYLLELKNKVAKTFIKICYYSRKGVLIFRRVTQTDICCVCIITCSFRLMNTLHKQIKISTS